VVGGDTKANAGDPARPSLSIWSPDRLENREHYIFMKEFESEWAGEIIIRI